MRVLLICTFSNVNKYKSSDISNSVDRRLKHVVLNMLNTAKKHYKGVALKALRKKAGWGNGTLEFILKQNF